MEDSIRAKVDGMGVSSAFDLGHEMNTVSSSQGDISGSVLKTTLIKSNNMPPWMSSAFPYVIPKVGELELLPQPVNHVCSVIPILTLAPVLTAALPGARERVRLHTLLSCLSPLNAHVDKQVHAGVGHHAS